MILKNNQDFFSWVCRNLFYQRKCFFHINFQLFNAITIYKLSEKTDVSKHGGICPLEGAKH